MNQTKRPTVMVIDEIPAHINQFLDIIKNQPLSIETLKELPKACTKIEAKKPDLIVLDLNTRFAEKKAICEYVFARPWLQVKFLFVVANVFSDLFYVPPHNLVGYISRPFYAGDVLGKIHSAIYDQCVRQLAT